MVYIQPLKLVSGSYLSSLSKAVIDLLMATAMIGEGTNYADLAYTVRLSEEEYGVGFRKGSDLAKALNDFFAECYEDESIVKCAEKYNLQDMLVK